MTEVSFLKSRTLSSRMWYLFLVYLSLVAIGYISSSLLTPGLFVVEAWPPVGAALALTLVLGYEVWPALILGGFVTFLLPLLHSSVSVSRAIPLASLLALVQTAMVLFGTWTTRTMLPDVKPLSSPSTLAKFLLCGGLLPQVLSASFSVSVLLAFGVVTLANAVPIWLAWASIGLVSVLILSPVVLTWTEAPPRSEWWRHSLLYLSAALSGYFIFLQVNSNYHSFFSYLAFMFVSWAAFRTGPRGVSLVTLIFSCLSIEAMVHHHGPFLDMPMETQIVLQNVYLIALSFSGLLLSSVLTLHEHTNQRLREAQRDASIGHYDYDLRSGLWSSSDELNAIFGISPDFKRTFEGWGSLIHPNDRERMLAYFSELLTNDKHFDQEYRIIRRNDSAIRWVHGLGKLIRNRSGQALRMFGTIQDITAMVDVEDERNKLLEQLRQAQKVHTLGRLVGTLSHDLNNLITVISSSIELSLVDADKSSHLYEDLTDAKEATTRARDLLRQLVAFSRKQAIQVRALDINTSLESFCRLLPHLLPKNISLNVSLAHNLPRIRSATNHLEQVLLNFVINSRDAMPDGGDLSITALSKTAPNVDGVLVEWLFLSVTDTGVGMTEEVRQRLFTPFFTTKDDGTGTGLGLSTCKSIINSMGGRIEVVSELGRGSTFSVWVPAAVVDQAQPVGT